MDPANLIGISNQMRFQKASKLDKVKPLPTSQAVIADASGVPIESFVDNPFVSSLPDLVFDPRTPCEMIGTATRLGRRK